MRFSAPVRLGSFSIVLPPSGLRGLVGAGDREGGWGIPWEGGEGGLAA